MRQQELTNDIITAAIEGFEAQKRRIDDQIADLRAMLSGGRVESGSPPQPATRKRPRKLSAAARKRIGDAQRKRWAAAKNSQPGSQPTPEAAKPKRKLSAAGRKAISEAAKKRWAAAKKGAAKKSAVNARSKRVAKKAAAVPVPTTTA